MPARVIDLEHKELAQTGSLKEAYVSAKQEMDALVKKAAKTLEAGEFLDLNLARKIGELQDATDKYKRLIDEAKKQTSGETLKSIASTLNAHNPHGQLRQLAHGRINAPLISGIGSFVRNKAILAIAASKRAGQYASGVDRAAADELAKINAEKQARVAAEKIRKILVSRQEQEVAQFAQYGSLVPIDKDVAAAELAKRLRPVVPGPELHRVVAESEIERRRANRLEYKRKRDLKKLPRKQREAIEREMSNVAPVAPPPSREEILKNFKPTITEYKEYAAARMAAMQAAPPAVKQSALKTILGHAGQLWSSAKFSSGILTPQIAAFIGRNAARAISSAGRGMLAVGNQLASAASFAGSTALIAGVIGKAVTEVVRMQFNAREERARGEMAEQDRLFGIAHASRYSTSPFMHKTILELHEAAREQHAKFVGVTSEIYRFFAPEGAAKASVDQTKFLVDRKLFDLQNKFLNKELIDRAFVVNTADAAVQRETGRVGTGAYGPLSYLDLGFLYRSTLGSLFGSTQLQEEQLARDLARKRADGQAKLMMDDLRLWGDNPLNQYIQLDTARHVNAVYENQMSKYLQWNSY